ncbi:MAG: hypothetical protein AABZ39_04570 [Spirochaetota bacterium]
MTDSKMLEMVREIKDDSYEEVKHLPLDEQLKQILHDSHVVADRLGFIPAIPKQKETEHA